MFREKVKKFHFVGIGGIGMSGIASILLDMNYEVSGSDLKESYTLQKLREKGAKIYIGHKKENVDGADVLVYSSAVNEDNPELVRAKEIGIATVPRGDMLADLFRMKEGIAISGSHGKTTTTSMIAHIAHLSGLDPTILIGGVLQTFESNARLGKSEIIISEADESDGSFLKLPSVVNVITNIDKEHIGFYKDIEDIKEAFLKFAENVPFYGMNFINADNEYCQEIIPKIKKRTITFGIKNGTYLAKNIEIENGFPSFDIFENSKFLVRISLSIPGIHNVYNALAASLVAINMGIDLKDIKVALKSFKNASRRIEYVGNYKGFLVYDDYGHHPTELRAVYKALKDMYKDKKVIIIFQPHRYSRTYHLFNDFVEFFKEIDIGFITPIYSANEENLFNVNSLDICKAVNKETVIYAENEEELFNYIDSLGLKEGVLVFMGAGSIGKWAKEITQREAITI